MKILLVDDNALFLASAQRFLAGIEAAAVATAHDGFKAMEHLGRERPDLVPMDLNMPGMNGLETIRRIKALDPAIRVIVVSLHDAVEFRTAAARAGAEDFVNKQDFAAKIPLLLKQGGVRAARSDRPEAGRKRTRAARSS